MKRAIEFSVMAITVLITVAVVGYLIYEGVFVAGDPAQLRVEIQQTGAREGSQAAHFARFQISNEGGTSVKSATVELTATLPDGSEEKGQVTLDFIPKGSTRLAVVEFSDRPQEGSIESRVVSYELP